LVHMTTSVVGRLRRKLAAVSDRPGSELEQPSMNMVMVKFGTGSKREWMGTRSVSPWGPGFPLISRRIARRVSSLIWVVLGKRLAAAGGNCLQGGEGPVHRR